MIQRITMAERPFRIAVTGHCCLSGDVTTTFVTVAFETILRRLRETLPVGLVALSGLAEGADTLFAEQALAQSIPLKAIIAADDLAETFVLGAACARFFSLCVRSQCIRLPFTKAGPDAYTGLGWALVNSADLLVAAWDGQPAPALGSTSGVVAYARQRGRPIIHIHTVRHRITGFATSGLLQRYKAELGRMSCQLDT